MDEEMKRYKNCPLGADAGLKKVNRASRPIRRERARQKLTPSEFHKWEEKELQRKTMARRKAGVLPRWKTVKHDAHVKAWLKALKAKRSESIKIRRAEQVKAARDKRRLAVLESGHKWCSKCKEKKPVFDFYRDKSSLDGFTKSCKVCDSQRVITTRNSNAINKLKHRVRNLILSSFKKNNFPKNGRTQEIIGCDYQEFLLHIERQFTKGMSWEKMGAQIHIDHIIPLASATNREEVIALNHFTNLRPLWADLNLSKGKNVHFLI